MASEEKQRLGRSKESKRERLKPRGTKKEKDKREKGALKKKEKKRILCKNITTWSI